MANLAQRLAQRTLELIDIASESHDELAIAGHVLDVLEEGGVPVRDVGDTCVLAGVAERGERPLVLFGGHFDTVPAQANRPGRIDGGTVHGLGAADMKGALAVMIELALAAPTTSVDLGYVFFGREELPFDDSALTPLLEREPGLRGADLVVMMEPTANKLHAGCLGNVNATWTFTGTAGHSARPWLADNAVHAAARGIAALAQVPDTPRDSDGLTYTEVVSVTTVHGGIARNVIPGECVAQINHRYPPGVSAAEAEQRLRGWCEPYGGDLRIDGNAPSAPAALTNPLVDRLRACGGGLAVEPKQAWTPVAEFALAGVDAINLGPGDPRFAHRADEQVEVAALVHCYELLLEFACA